ncbi:FKBP-type peptidyl-prolyl cis-trans isomerase family protein [Lysobacter antibioticus]|jgi:FKBP-type peptidyl-prolyl cis-trans isomerase FkpA|uniref:Peptidyl-prolyl cis-trans isomerase n=1 Tax=Lysobacter antibioticus TaxID=84531 RepID=A0A0S2DU86_LYSAN|nr:FKBP-type peptidyl-prolyl cis-trans isomerase [Lysobacter antibioticus]ALN62014.1 FKBP-type peptidyl-prolyl cis-trans isomerase family protein [Lysobacter antibioticus]ALN80644.1 FKBP-type peptidyl-prolyl cis-trans isomerase family protein [Lysobacter antibioticus]
MKAFVRGAAVLITTAALFSGVASAQDKTVLANDREKISYAIGLDVASSLKPVGPDLDTAAFERAVKNVFDGGKPLITQEEARTVDQALRARIASRDGKPVPGAAPGAPPPPVAKDKVGLLIGTFMVGPSLQQIKSEIELPLLVQALRTSLSGGKPLLAEAEARTVLTGFSERLQAKMKAEAAAAGDANLKKGKDFLETNKKVKGVFVTGSGLQYMVLRQGSGERPKPTDKVSVNYKGTLLDGSTFDSSYDRGQPAEFPVNGVIQGWQEGLAMMPVGSKFKFWIPAELAYGPSGAPPKIGPNATLEFEVELLDIL